LPPGVAAKAALKHQMPTVGVCGVGKVKVESIPLTVEVPVDPMGVPPVHGVDGALAWHIVQLTVPVGAPPAGLPATVAVSPQVLPTAVALGTTIVVVKPGVAVLTLTHSALSGVPETLWLEPV
jgi:hypothetical protein